jgi:hypothetical protein
MKKAQLIPQKMERNVMEYVDGEVAFSGLTGRDTYGKYSIVVNLDEDAANKLESEGVKIKDWEGKKQRAFRTKFDFQYVDADKKAQEGELERGSKVTIAYKLGEPYAEYGVTTYLQGVKVVKRASPASKGDVSGVNTAEIYNSDVPF